MPQSDKNIYTCTRQKYLYVYIYHTFVRNGLEYTIVSPGYIDKLSIAVFHTHPKDHAQGIRCAAGDNSFFAPVLTPEEQAENEDPSDSGQTPFAPFAGAGTVQGPPLASLVPPAPPAAQTAPDNTTGAPVDGSNPDGGAPNSTDVGVPESGTNTTASVFDTGGTAPELAPPEDGTGPAQAPGTVADTPADAPGAAAPVTAPAAVPAVDPDLGLTEAAPQGAAPPDAALPPAQTEGPAAFTPAGETPVDPDDPTLPATPPVTETPEEPETPVDPLNDAAGAPTQLFFEPVYLR